MPQNASYLNNAIFTAINRSNVRDRIELDNRELRKLAGEIADEIRVDVAAAALEAPLQVVATISEDREVLLYGNVPFEGLVVDWDLFISAFGEKPLLLKLANGRKRRANVYDGCPAIDVPFVNLVFAAAAARDGVFRCPDPLVALPAAVVSSIG